MKKELTNIAKYLATYGLMLVGPVTILAIVMVVYDRLHGGAMDSDMLWQSPYMTAGMMAGSLLCIVVFLWKRWAVVGLGRITRSDVWMVGMMSALLFLGWFFPEDYLIRVFDVPDDMTEQDFENMTGGVIGFIDTGFMAPVAEELLCRGAILGALLRLMPRRPWVAIVVQAVIFGLIHMNPVQTVFGTFYGILLGWLCWRTASVLPGIFIHILNNASALLLPESFDNSLAELNVTATIAALVLSIAVLACGIVWFEKKYQVKGNRWELPTTNESN